MDADNGITVQVQCLSHSLRQYFWRKKPPHGTDIKASCIYFIRKSFFQISQFHRIKLTSKTGCQRFKPVLKRFTHLGRKHIYIQIFYMAVIVQQRAQRCRQMSGIAVIGSIDNVDRLFFRFYSLYSLFHCLFHSHVLFMMMSPADDRSFCSIIHLISYIPWSFYLRFYNTGPKM